MLIARAQLFKPSLMLFITLSDLLLSFFISILHSGIFDIYSFSIIYIFISFKFFSIPLFFIFAIPWYIIYLIIMVWIFDVMWYFSS